MNYDKEQREIEGKLAALRERRQNLAYALKYGHGEASDPGRRDMVQIEISELDDQIRVYEMAISHRSSTDPLSSVNDRLDTLTRIIEGDSATGYAGVRQVVRLQEELLATMRVRVSQLVWGFWIIMALVALSNVSQLFFMWRLAG